LQNVDSVGLINNNEIKIGKESSSYETGELSRETKQGFNGIMIFITINSDDYFKS